MNFENFIQVEKRVSQQDHRSALAWNKVWD